MESLNSIAGVNSSEISSEVHWIPVKFPVDSMDSSEWNLWILSLDSSKWNTVDSGGWNLVNSFTRIHWFQWMESSWSSNFHHQWQLLGCSSVCGTDHVTLHHWWQVFTKYVTRISVKKNACKTLKPMPHKSDDLINRSIDRSPSLSSWHCVCVVSK